MNKVLICAFALGFFSQILSAQSLPDSELIERLNLNRSHFEELDHGLDLVEKAQRSNKDVSINRIVKETATLCDSCPSEDSMNNSEIKRATHESSLVVVGHIVRSTSALTKNNGFVFTDSQLVIDEVWKSKKLGAPLKTANVGEEITITSPGGVVLSGGHKVEAYLSSNKIPRIGHSYLMYLVYLPDSRSYKATSLDGFEVTETGITSLRSSLPAPLNERVGDKNHILNAMRASTERAEAEDGK